MSRKKEFLINEYNLCFNEGVLDRRRETKDIKLREFLNYEIINNEINIFLDSIFESYEGIFVSEVMKNILEAILKTEKIKDKVFKKKFSKTIIKFSFIIAIYFVIDYFFISSDFDTRFLLVYILIVNVIDSIWKFMPNDRKFNKSIRALQK